MLHYNEKTIKYSPYTAIIAKPNTQPHTMTYWKITYAIEGTSIQRTDGITHTLTKTSILIIKPGAQHQIISYSDEKYRHRDIYVSDSEMKKYCSFLSSNPYDYLNSSAIFFETNILAIENLEYTLNLFPTNSTEKNDYLSSLHTSVVINILALFLEHQEKSFVKPKWLTMIENRVNDVTYLQNNVTFLIQDVPYSHGHICREFKKYNNTTLAEFLNRAKIAYSNILLMDKQKSIAEIAYFLGFTQQSAFIKYYKSYFKISPGAYRKKYLLNKNLSSTSFWGV